MYLMYVDECGDSGNNTSASRYFGLSGLVMHETYWRACLNDLIVFRNAMRANYGLKLREEIHAYNMISKPGPLLRISRWDRLTILKDFIDTIEGLPGISIINVLVDKSGRPGGYDPFTEGWEALIQRLENTVLYRNFPGPTPPNVQDMAIVLPDDTNRKKLTDLVRRMRYYNPVPYAKAGFGGAYRNLQLKLVIEDPYFKDSRFSYFSQAADCVAYMLYQAHVPNKYIRQRAGKGYFGRLNVSLCRAARPSDPQGIVRL